MKLGLRGKLFLVPLTLTLLVGLVCALYLESRLRALLEAQTEADLVRFAEVVRDGVEMTSAADSTERAERLAERFSSSTGMRVSIVAADGRLLGDSELPAAELPSVPRDTFSAELRAASAEGRSAGRQYSARLHAELLYVALPYRTNAESGIVRVATPLSTVNAVLGHLHWAFLAAGSLGLVLAVVSSAAVAEVLGRRMGAVLNRVRAARGPESLRGGDADRPRDTSPDEFVSLAGSFTRLGRELDRAVAELAAERDRLETVLDGMSEAVLALDKTARVTLANPAAHRLFRLERFEPGVPLLELVRHAELSRVAADAIRGDRPEVECELALSGRQVLAVGAPLRQTGGCVLVVHDVTELRRLEAVRRDFVANVSHELRTPVSVIQATAETLLAGALDEPAEARRFVEALRRNAERLSALLADLLDLARIEAGQRRYAVERVALRAAVVRAVEAVEQKARAKQISITISVDVGLSVLADEKALDQIMLNLLDNAVKYTPEAGHLEVAAATNGEGVTLSVDDDGPGIEPRHRERIFERFYRVDPGRSRELGGTGLGLSITKHLVEALGGSISVRPLRPHGSSFRVELPSAGAPRVSGEGGEP